MESGLAFVFSVMLWIATAGQTTHAGDVQKWFRGQLHSHSYWSDGRGFPEQAVDAYKQRGYDFLSITDHNRFADDKDAWRELFAEEGKWPPKISKSIFDRYLQTFGKDWVETKTEGNATSVRLKTYAEIKAKFEEPGKFILLPGVEMTQKIKKHEAHLNYINLPMILPCIKGAGLLKTAEEPKTISELISLNASEARLAADKLQKPYMLILNHPFWKYYDIVPQNLIDCPEIRFFEICSVGSDYAPNSNAETYTIDKFWDIVNAFRSVRGQTLLYGIGADDAHFYDEKRIDVDKAWVMVRATALTPEDLLASMHRGDFYATNGLLLEEVTFTANDNTLRVKVKEEHGVNYNIHFITTKQGFDQSVTGIESPAEGKRPARTIPIYSDDIGRIVKTVSGSEGSYQLEPDDLYVRARVESNSPSKITRNFYPKVKTAWTQPYTAKKMGSE